MARIPATPIERLMDGTITTDARHLVLRLRDVDASDVVLGIPVDQVPCLVELCARALADCARAGHDVESKLAGSHGRFRAEFCKLGRGANGEAQLALTLDSGGILVFALPEPMADALCSGAAAFATLPVQPPRW